MKRLLLMLLVTPLICGAQSLNMVIEGKIINKSGNAVPFAALQVKNKYVGISANEEGRFRFVIPPSSAQDTLLVSSLGYTSFQRPLSAINTTEFQTITLSEAAIVLKEVVVKNISPSEILQEAIAKMDEHFDNNAYTMESFFRIAVTKDSACIGLLDAAIDIHDGGFKKKHSLSANLLQLRKIAYKDNWVPGSTISFRSPAVSIEEEFGNRLRNGILDRSKAKRDWTLELVDAVQQDEDLFYIIKAKPIRSATHNPYYHATLRIRESDYAIMQVVYDYKNELIDFSKQFPAAHPFGGYLGDNTLLHYNTIKGEFNFTEYNGKLYLSRAFYEEKARLSNKAQKVAVDYSGSFEIFVNRIFQERTGQASKLIAKHEDIFKLTDQYDSTFWANYNKPISTNLYEKAITNMAKNGNLTDQFQYFTSLRSKNSSEYQLTQRKESEHFTIQYTPADAVVIDTIVNTLERNYPRITNELKVTDQPIVTVKIFPNLKAYQQSTGNTIAWMVGSSYGADEFRMVSPLNPGPEHTYETILKGMVHEFTHCVNAQINAEKFPVRWLWEAIACYEAGQFTDPAKLDYVVANKVPAMEQINKDVDKGYVYELGYVLIEYMKETWGMDKVVELLKSNADLKNVLGVDEKKFETGFNAFLTLHYLNNSK